MLVNRSYLQAILPLKTTVLPITSPLNTPAKSFAEQLYGSTELDRQSYRIPIPPVFKTHEQVQQNGSYRQYL